MCDRLEVCCRCDGAMRASSRIARVTPSHTYSPACMPLAVEAIVSSVVPFGSRAAPIADYIRLIAVAFPLTSARRSSAYAGQLIADCCGDFPSLAAIPPAFVFGGGPVKRSGPAEACAQTGIDGRERCPWPAGRGRRPGPPRRRVAPGTAPLRPGAAVLYGGCGLDVVRTGSVCWSGAAWPGVPAR